MEVDFVPGAFPAQCIRHRHFQLTRNASPV
jgi:hypothetical protein